jgi:hypothetical protein
MAFTKITTDGEAFITEVCKIGGNSLLSGKNKYPMPYTSPPLDKVWTWTCNIMYGGAQVTAGEPLSKALIAWFNKYGEMYQMDANVLAAQAYIESKYKMWDFPGGQSNASGVNQFVMLTTFDIIVENRGNSITMLPGEIAEIINGLTNPYSKDSYDVTTKAYQIPYANHPILHQNIINNPEIMIKAQARYMKNIADKSNSLASTALFCYSRGLFMRHTYSKSITFCDNSHKANPDYKTEGLNYVLRIFGVLGDKDNALEPGYKIRGHYFGYDIKMGENDNKNLKLVPNNWSPYDANVDESAEFNLQGDFTENKADRDLTVEALSEYPKYKFIYFPQSDYHREKTKKLQLVLHHTASGEGSGNDILWWEQQVQKTGDKVSVSFIVTRDGTILQLFSTNYWASHLGITEKLLLEYGTSGIGNELLNSQSIGIEIDSWGGLVNSGENWYPPINGSSTVANTEAKPVPVAKVITYNSPDYPKGYHGFYGFEKYTPDQISALRTLIAAIKLGNPDIKLGYVNDIYSGVDMWGKDAVPGVWTAEKAAYAEKPGIWTHVSYVPDKSDCQPQPELISLLKSL